MSHNRPAMLLIKTNNTIKDKQYYAILYHRLFFLQAFCNATPNRQQAHFNSFGESLSKLSRILKSSSFYQETHKDRRLLPNPALSGRCIEDFYPLVYFLGLCKGVSLSALQKHVWETPASKKMHLTPLTERKMLKDNTFCYYLHDYG